MVTFCTGDQERISETVVIIVLLFGKNWTFINKWQTCLQILNIEGVAVVLLFIVLKFYHFTVMQTFHSLFISSINPLFAKCTEKHNLNRPRL